MGYHTPSLPPLIRWTGMWEKKSAHDGASYFVGRLAGLRVLLLPNRRRQSDADPPFLLMVQPAEDASKQTSTPATDSASPDAASAPGQHQVPGEPLLALTGLALRLQRTSARAGAGERRTGRRMDRGRGARPGEPVHVTLRNENRLTLLRNAPTLLSLRNNGGVVMALSNAERQRRWRERVKAKARTAETPAVVTLPALIERLPEDSRDQAWAYLSGLQSEARQSLGLLCNELMMDDPEAAEIAARIFGFDPARAAMPHCALAARLGPRKLRQSTWSWLRDKAESDEPIGYLAAMNPKLAEAGVWSDVT